MKPEGDGGEVVVEKTPAELEAERLQSEADAEAGFAKGVAKVRGEEPPPDDGEKKDGKVDDSAAAKATEGAAAAKAAEEAAAAKAAAEAEAEDPWKDVPPIVRERLQKLDEFPAQISKLAGHIGGFKRQIDQITATAKSAAPDGVAAPTKVEIQEALADPEKWKQLEEDFPEWMGPVSSELVRLRKDMAAVAKSVRAAPADTKEADPIDTAGIVAEAEERAYVRMKHPDWKSICATSEFRDWLGKQGDDIKTLAQSEVAEDAISLFDTYKAHRKKLAEDAEAKLRKEKRLQSAVVPTGSSESPSAGISDDEAFERGLKRVRGR